MLTTWQFRIKDSGAEGKWLSRISRAVNFVWNFCKQTQIHAFSRCGYRVIDGKEENEKKIVGNFITAYEFSILCKGAGAELSLHSQSVQAVCEEYARRRFQFKKLLRWRGKKSPGWIPFKASGIQWLGGSFVYCKRKYSIWNSRDLPGDACIKTGSFSQDKRGRWYVNLTFKSEMLEKRYRAQQSSEARDLGVDLGIKTLATLSNGDKIERPNLRPSLIEGLRKLEKQRKAKRRWQSRTKQFTALPKQKKIRKLHAKVANQRNDYLQKETTNLVRKARLIAMGNLACRFLNRSKTMSGISLDNGIGKFKQMTRFKAVRAGVDYLEVNERNSTQTCSSCEWMHPPDRRIGLGVREWTCPSCNTLHDRDINAALRHLRLGHQTLIRSAVA